jgi:hypothetical protein
MFRPNGKYHPQFIIPVVCWLIAEGKIVPGSRFRTVGASKQDILNEAKNSYCLLFSGANWEKIAESRETERRQWSRR